MSSAGTGRGVTGPPPVCHPRSGPPCHSPQSTPMTLLLSQGSSQEEILFIPHLTYMPPFGNGVSAIVENQQTFSSSFYFYSLIL